MITEAAYVLIKLKKISMVNDNLSRLDKPASKDLME